MDNFLIKVGVISQAAVGAPLYETKLKVSYNCALFLAVC